MARIPGVGLPVWAESTARGYRGASVCGWEFSRRSIVARKLYPSGTNKGVFNVVRTFRNQNNYQLINSSQIIVLLSSAPEAPPPLRSEVTSTGFSWKQESWISGSAGGPGASLGPDRKWRRLSSRCVRGHRRGGGRGVEPLLLPDFEGLNGTMSFITAGGRLC